MRCETVMAEDLCVVVSNGSYGIDAKEKGLFKNPLGRIRCAVCPRCGYTEMYIDDPENIRALMEKRKEQWK